MAKLRSDSGISSTLNFVPKETSSNGTHKETENLIKSCEVEIEDDECGEFILNYYYKQSILKFLLNF